MRVWLEAIGFGQYADAFEANDIDADLLPQIDDQLLKDIGVLSAGHRLRLRNAIAKLAPESIAGVNATNAIAPVGGSPLPTPGTPAPVSSTGQALAGAHGLNRGLKAHLRELPRSRGSEGWRPSGGS